MKYGKCWKAWENVGKYGKMLQCFNIVMFGVVGCMAGGRVDAPVLQGQVQGQRDIQEHNNIKPIRKYKFYFLIPKITPYQDSYP